MLYLESFDDLNKEKRDKKELESRSKRDEQSKLNRVKKHEDRKKSLDKLKGGLKTQINKFKDQRVEAHQKKETELNKYRYADKIGHPGIEDFLKDPQNQVIANKLKGHLETDATHGRGKVRINFTGEGDTKKDLRPSDFIKIVQDSLLTWEITDYEYDNQDITIEANPVQGIKKGQMMNVIAKKTNTNSEPKTLPDKE
jgi:hypothetical protein